MINRHTFIVGALFWLLSGATLAQETVHVGIYTFAPFAFENSQRTSTGVSHDLIKALNEHQSQFLFKLYLTTPSARFKAFEHHKFDMLVFESKHWGWQNKPIVSSNVYLEGGEVYIALNKEGRDQRYFDRLSDKSIIGVRGYHYGFAGMNNDPNYLKQNFHVLLTHSNASSIKMLLGERGDIAVVTQAYLKLFLKDNPEQVGKLLISEKKDQHYQHTVLIRAGHNLNPQRINTWLAQLRNDGTLPAIWKKWGLDSAY